MTTRWALAGYLLGGAMVFLMSCSDGVSVTSANSTTSLVPVGTATTETVTPDPSVEEPPPENLAATSSEIEWDRQAEDDYVMGHLGEILGLSKEIGLGGRSDC